MYVPPHNGITITIAIVFILFFSSVNDGFFFMDVLLLLYELPYFGFCFQIFCFFFLHTLAYFVFGLWAVKFASK
jgi:hypothetical protein